jgi:hypothetical protein
MNVQQLVDLFDSTRRRYHLVGDANCGVIAGLDLEGRLFTVVNGEVINRVNPDAFTGTSSRKAYLNPGGDGLWPAPEGSCLGYEYATGAWRVPPGLSGARYWVEADTPRRATIRAEVDLINARGLGLPVGFGRQIQVVPSGKGAAVTVTESLEYLGTQVLTSRECLLAPWSLAQFDCGPGCEVLFPGASTCPIWDLYDPSDDRRWHGHGLWHTRTEGGGKRYQIGLGPAVEWIEFRDPRRALAVRRTTEPLPPGFRHLDLADRSPAQSPTDIAIRFSVYSDPTCFMEIEAAGGCPEALHPGLTTAVTVHTDYMIEE